MGLDDQEHFKGFQEQVLKLFDTAQCSYCRRFYTQPFLCVPGTLHSNCFFFKPLTQEEKEKIQGEKRDCSWTWRAYDMVLQVHEHTYLSRCRKCGSLNPNPDKYICWKCGENLCCHDGFVLRYDIRENYGKCEKSSCRKEYTWCKICKQATLIRSVKRGDWECTNCHARGLSPETIEIYIPAPVNEAPAVPSKAVIEAVTFQTLPETPKNHDVSQAKEIEPTPVVVKPNGITSPTVTTTSSGAAPVKKNGWKKVIVVVFVLILIGLGIKYISGNKSVPLEINVPTLTTPISTSVIVITPTSIESPAIITSTTITTSITYAVSKFTVNVDNKSGIGNYLTDKKGMTLYWTKGTITLNWPVFCAGDIVLPGSLNLGDFKTIKLADGTYQTTYKGWPLYYCLNDKLPGDIQGQGYGGICSIVNPSAAAPPASVTTISTTTTSITVKSYSSTTTTTIKTIAATTTTATTTTTKSKSIDPRTGVYNNFFLGVVNSAEGVIGGDGCYDDGGNFIVLINNKNATNPTYSQLVSFLQSNKTDQYPYILTNRLLSSYYGTAESHVDLARLQGIIDGTIQPANPDVCADFAERLHNDAEKAGIRCAYVSIDLSDDSGGNTLNAFQTTDRGLVYIDVTGVSLHGPTRCVKTVNVQVGSDYVPNSLFPEAGWSNTWHSLGIVTNIEVFWDGRWQY